MTDKIKVTYPAIYPDRIDDAVAGALHNMELIPGCTVVGSILTEEQMKLQYSPLAPSVAGRWTRCPGAEPKWRPHPGPQEEFFNGPDVTYAPGSLTKKGNPQ